MVEQDFALMSEVQQKWCSRILLKNLRCGASETTVNKIWPDVVKKFAVALAETLEARWADGRLVITDDIIYPVIVEPKLDGLRCIAVKNAGNVTLYTRNGTVLETLPIIKAALEAHPLDNIVFDGEAIGKDWNESASVIMSHKKAKGDANITYNVFDAVPLKSWVERSTSSSFEERRKFLEKLFNIGIPAGVKCLKLTDKIIAGSDGDILRFYEKCLALGYEGVMIKDPSAKYAWKRSSAVLKLKPISTFEGVVIGWHTGTAGSKRHDSFGGFSVLLPNGVSTAVGSGLDDKVREEITKKGPDNYIGKVVECEAQSLTDDGKMRFPVFCRFRDSNDVDPNVLNAFEKWKRQG
jgi:ATP-dependent DNA ligase